MLKIINSKGLQRTSKQDFSLSTKSECAREKFDLEIFELGSETAEFEVKH